MADTMTTQLLTLADTDLQGLATALRSGRLVAPFTGLAVQRVASPRLADALAHELQTLVTQGCTPVQIATLMTYCCTIVHSVAGMRPSLI